MNRLPAEHQHDTFFHRFNYYIFSTMSEKNEMIFGSSIRIIDLKLTFNNEHSCIIILIEAETGFGPRDKLCIKEVNRGEGERRSVLSIILTCNKFDHTLSVIKQNLCHVFILYCLIFGRYHFILCRKVDP